MLYEPTKTKQYILIGAIAVVLAVLVIVAAPLIYKQKKTQTPTANLPMTAEQKKIQKDQDKLVEMAKGQKNSLLSAEQIQKDQDKLIEEAKSRKDIKSPEEIQKDMDKLINMAK